MHAFPMVVEEVPTHSRCEMLDITELVRSAAARLRIREGLVIVQSPHTTAAITINENADPDVQRDLLAKLQRLAPKEEPFYRHGEGNSDSHLKTSLLGISHTLIVQEGQLMLGTWQGVYLCEFDGPRRRQVWIKGFAAQVEKPRPSEIA